MPWGDLSGKTTCRSSWHLSQHEAKPERGLLQFSLSGRYAQLT